MRQLTNILEGILDTDLDVSEDSIKAQAICKLMDERLGQSYVGHVQRDLGQILGKSYYDSNVAYKIKDGHPTIQLITVRGPKGIISQSMTLMSGLLAGNKLSKVAFLYSYGKWLRRPQILENKSFLPPTSQIAYWVISNEMYNLIWKHYAGTH